MLADTDVLRGTSVELQNPVNFGEFAFLSVSGAALAQNGYSSSHIRRTCIVILQLLALPLTKSSVSYANWDTTFLEATQPKISRA